MSSQALPNAEKRFRDAFDRLKVDRPNRLPVGTRVSQNNVAREAGLDPSALKKSRFPSLVRDIQVYVETYIVGAQPSERQQRAKLHVQEKDRADEVRALKAQRDAAHSQLLSAQRAVLELLQENADLRTRIAELSGDVLSISSRSSK